MTAAQVNTAVSAPATETAVRTVQAPAFDGVSGVSFYTSDANANPPNKVRALVSWPGRDPIDILVEEAVPAGERAGLRLGIARCVLYAREKAGAS